MMDDLSFYNDTDTINQLQLFTYYFNLVGCVLYTLIAIVGIIANGIVLIMVGKHKQLRTAMNYFITNLAAADLIILVVLVVPRDINFLTSWNIFRIQGSLIAILYIQHVCIQATALILAIMSISRYTMVVLPLKAKAEWTVHRVWFCCGASWFVSALLYIPLFFGVLSVHEGGYEPTIIPVTTKVFASLKMVFIFLLPFSVIVFCYTRIIITFRRGRYNLQKKHSANIDTDASDDQTRRLARMVLIIILVFLLSWAPMQSLQTWLFVREHTLPASPAQWRLIEVLSFLFRLLIYAGSSINPFIYAYTNPSFKKLNMFRVRKSADSVATQSSQL